MNIFEIVANVNISVSVLCFCRTTVKLYQKTLSEQGNRFYFVFSLTTHYQNHEFICVCSKCDKALRETFDFSHKNYFNNCKGCLIKNSPILKFF